ncbi:MAG: TetR/AcrR family transcriptional regulator [Pseudomonadota bacterium]
MARTGGDKTRKRILAVAEKLFAARGFDATSVDQIAHTAGVNKALIYYHFKNKDDLVLQLFESIIEEVSAYSEQQTGSGASNDSGDVRHAVKKEVEFLTGRKRILSLMLAEALRSNQHDDFLFRCAEIVIQKEHAGDLVQTGAGTEDGARKTLPRAQMVHEFFTGFVPLVTFVALRDKWCSYFNYDADQITDEFIEAFADTHLDSQLKRR